MIIFGFFVLFSAACNDPKTKEELRSEFQLREQSEHYDKLKAEKLGADEYGMKTYVMAFLKTGPNKSLDSVKRAQLQTAHLENITKMAEDGNLVLAGPFLDDDDIRGIYIFNVQTIEEAEALTNTDPAIEAGSLVMELHQWYGSAALIELNQIHKTIQKKGLTEN
jgi:uncharacterized protein YciI